MKTVLFLFTLLFAVVCYAAPPPDAQIDFSLEEITVVIDVDNINVSAEFMATAPKVPEVTACRKYLNLVTVNSAATMDSNYAELTALNGEPYYSVLKMPPLPYSANVVTKNNFLQLPNVEFTKGVITTVNCLAINKRHPKFKRNHQHSNYGYPFSANRQVSFNLCSN